LPANGNPEAALKDDAGNDTERVHGARDLGRVIVDGYGDDVRSKDGYFGELASNGAFRQLIAELREKLKETGGDPIEGEPEQISKGRADKLLKEGDPHEAGVILSVVETFAQNMAKVVKALFKLRDWDGVERIAIGGGFRDSRVGELVIGRAAILVREISESLELVPIRHDPDHAGVIGAAWLFPEKLPKGRHHLIGVDIGGSNFRCGLVDLNAKGEKGRKSSEVVELEIWRHASEEPTLDACMQRLGDMLRQLLKTAEKRGLAIAPLIGVGVPGTVLEDGGLEGGVLNLPGDWKSDAFNLPARIRQMLSEIQGEPTQVIVHNDAVVHGLSQAPYMTDVERWAVLTIGTGLGNALFRNKKTTRK
jgi:predicted NBD/HSP70 family sugar kinase